MASPGRGNCAGTKSENSENGFPRQGQLCRNNKVRILKMASPGRGICLRSGHSRGAWYGISDPGIPEEHGMVTSYIRSLFHGLSNIHVGFD